MEMTHVSKTACRTLVVALLLFAAGSRICWACRATPHAQLMSPDEQIAGASNIAIAKAVSESATADGRIEYKFIVQRRLLGADEREFTVNGGKAALHDTSYDSHADPGFWHRGGGRSSADTACLISPVFSVGKSYIVFLDSTPTRRSFERIDVRDGIVDENDKWLLYIRKKLDARGR
jgi:hypothetical protein